MVAMSLQEQGIGPERREEISQDVRSVRDAIATGDFSNLSLPSVVTVEEAAPNIPRDTNPYRGAADVLRRIEENKLMGGPPLR
jgi:hypothetical protein